GKYYTAVLSEQSDVPGMQRQVAQFFIRHRQFREAATVLRKMLENRAPDADRDSAWARHSLAMILATDNDARKFPEALKLVGLDLDAQGQLIDNKRSDATDEECRSQARVLATRTRKAWRAKAISVLEGLERRSALTDDDRFLLAQLFDQNGQWPKARDHYGNLVADHPNNQVFLAGYVQSLLEHREWDTALRWLDRLEQVEK